jgi:hypothetical protein
MRRAGKDPCPTHNGLVTLDENACSYRRERRFQVAKLTATTAMLNANTKLPSFNALSMTIISYPSRPAAMGHFHY